MQFEITDKAAVIFASEFYAALAEGFPVDAAVAEARKVIYAQPNDVEWGTPDTIYLRSADGVLFNLTQTPFVKTKQPARPQPTAATPELKITLPEQSSAPVPKKKVKRKESEGGAAVTPAEPTVISTPPENLSTRKSTGLIRHVIDIKAEGEEIIHYDGKEVSRKSSLFGATHVFKVSESDEMVSVQDKNRHAEGV